MGTLITFYRDSKWR